jgi:3-hydroxyacyl-[acyl-carrier-protein] dehydratase
MIIATRQVPEVEPWTEAHFPDTPIVPGVLLLEGMAQTCGILARFRNSTTTGPASGMLSALRSARFHQPVSLVYQAELIGRAGPLHSFRATTRVRDQLVAEAELILTVGSGPSALLDASEQGSS